MKKTLVILILIFLATPFVKNISQEEQTTGDLAQSQKKLAQEYFQQGKEMSKQEEEKMLKTMSQEMRAKLDEIKKLNKEKYQQLLRSSYSVGVFSTAYAQAEGVFKLNGFSEGYKKTNELEIDVELLALKLKNADNNSQQKIKSDLSAKLGELFDIKETQKQYEVQQLEKRLKELKQSLQYRLENKNEIVQRRIQELLGDSKYLRWE
jgi:uncharacterized tellurite resistance protein B-like protein